MSDVVIVVIADKPFSGEEELVKKGCNVCHPEGTELAAPFRAIKAGTAKVALVGKVTDGVLQRMIAKAEEKGLTVHRDLKPDDLLALF